MKLEEALIVMNRVKAGEKTTRTVQKEVSDTLSSLFECSIEFFSDCIDITVRNEDFKFCSRSYKWQKAEVTADWIKNKVIQTESQINKGSVSLNLAKIINKELNLGYAFYISSYGIGTDNFFGRNYEREEKISEFLTKNGIKHRVELSDKGWVTRFLLSKEKENLEKIKSL